MPLRKLLKRIHMYAGLMSFTALIVYGLAGLYSTSQPPWSERPYPETQVREVPFEFPASGSDKELADAIYRHLDMPLTGPMYDWALKRDDDQNLFLNFYTVNGFRKVTALESQGLLRVESSRTGLWQFVNGAHSTTLQWAAPRFLVQGWAWYNELAIWSLLLMAGSGIALWLMTRPGYVPGVVSFALGSGMFVTLWLLAR
ncbi:MAG: PepSY domain-containing protein [Bryobacterales bacterium]|nr:PepSY domain-containing protein [Bryobacterales bacterium]